MHDSSQLLPKISNLSNFRIEYLPAANKNIMWGIEGCGVALTVLPGAWAIILDSGLSGLADTI